MAECVPVGRSLQTHHDMVVVEVGDHGVAVGIAEIRVVDVVHRPQWVDPAGYRTDLGSVRREIDRHRDPSARTDCRRSVRNASSVSRLSVPRRSSSPHRPQLRTSELISWKRSLNDMDQLPSSRRRCRPARRGVRLPARRGIVVERLDHRLMRAGPIHEVWGVRAPWGGGTSSGPRAAARGADVERCPGDRVAIERRAARPGRRGCPGDVAEVHAGFISRRARCRTCPGCRGSRSGDHDMIGFADHGRDVVHHGHARVRCVGARRRTPMTFISSASERRATSDPMPPIPRITTVAPRRVRPGSRVGTNRPVVGRGRRRGVPWRLRASGRRPTHRSIRR